MILLAVVFLLAVPAWSNTVLNEDRHATNVVSVTQCRASCLDQTSHNIRNVKNCKQDADCFMCWEMCKMLLMDNSKVWSPICRVQQVCTPGCKVACHFVEKKENYGDFPVSILFVRNYYDPKTDRVIVEWFPNTHLERKSAVLYSVLLKDENERWSLLGQTTSNGVHVPRGLFYRRSTIRIISANATQHISDSLSSYFGSLATEVSTNDSGLGNSWKPHLENLRKIGMGIETTIVWPDKLQENGTILYEVSWSAIDDVLDITGHLHTTNNVAILTLRPDSRYSVQIDCLGTNKTVTCHSEPLIFNTTLRATIKNDVKKTSGLLHDGDEETAVLALAILSGLFLIFILGALVWSVCRRWNNVMTIPVCKISSITGSTEELMQKSVSPHDKQFCQEEKRKINFREKYQGLNVV